MTYIGRSESSDADDEILMFVEGYADDGGVEQPVFEESDLENIYDYASFRSSSGSPIVGGDDDTPYEGTNLNPAKQTATTDGQRDRKFHHGEEGGMTEQEADQATENDEEEKIDFQVVSPTDDGNN